ncbi:MAG TPA: PIG-L family deacetylase [Methanoculleus thermophilus]|nr:PIG-L family deacetylase [Methanoculleus thermophilus]
MFTRLLVLSPHTDDGELSAGGTIARAIDAGKEVFYVAFSTCEKSIPECYGNDILKKECLEATRVLGIPSSNTRFLNFEVRNFSGFRQEILDEMILIGRDIRPDLVITPSSFDTHQDHNVIYGESVRAFKKTASIWGMEHPWNNLSFRTDIFVDLKEEHVNKKIDALKRYESQMPKDYFQPSYIMSCACTRGMMIARKYAEVFECIRTTL